MKNEREVFFLPECKEHIISLFNGELEIEDCKEEGCKGLKKCVVTFGEIEKFRKGGYAIGKERFFDGRGYKDPRIEVSHLRGVTNKKNRCVKLKYDGTNLRTVFSLYSTLFELSPNQPLIIHRAKEL